MCHLRFSTEGWEDYLYFQEKQTKKYFVVSMD